MNFQFKCPQGHLLEGDSSTAGQQCHCPTCGMLFIIPEPLPADTGSQPPGSFHSLSPPPDQSAPPHPGDPSSRFESAPSFAPAGEFTPAGPFTPETNADAQPSPAFGAATGGEDEELLHIPCPNGHELETPREMLGQDVLCPYCQAQFRLREKDSVEHKRRRAEEQARRERRQSRAWFNWSIVALVLVVLGILFLIFSTSG
jgi:hypothetical protein